MTWQEVLAVIEKLVNELRGSKGLPPVEVRRQTALLERSLDIDSLDLAGVLVELEQVTEKDPFADGMVDFTTAGELADLYATA